MAKIKKEFCGIVSFPVAANTSVAAGKFVTLSGGYAIEAVAASTELAGVAVEASDATATVAGTVKVNVDPETVYLATADANFAATMIGTHVDLTDGNLVDVGTSITDVLTVVGGVVGSANNVEVVISKHQIFNA